MKLPGSGRSNPVAKSEVENPDLDPSSRAESADEADPKDPAKTGNSRRTYFPALDGIRAIAVLIVVVAHGSLRLWPQDMRLRSGWVGVQLFFVLSGFLITYLLLAESDRTGRISLKDFYIRRALRIWPLYYAMLFLYAFVLPRINPASFSNVYVGQGTEGWEAYRDSLWPHVFFLQNYLVEIGDVRLGLGVYWSLAVEEHFYLVWPIMVVLLSRRFLAPVLVLAIAGSVVVSLLHDRAVLDPTAGFGEFTHNNIFSIATGCLIGYAWVEHGARLQQISARTARLASIVAWVVVCVVVAEGFAPVSVDLVPGTGTVLKVLAVAAAAVLIVATISRPADAPPGLLAHPYAVHIGRISFGLYLTHSLVLGAIARSVSLWNTSKAGQIVGMLVFCWTSIVVADFVYRRFEAPILTFKHRFQRF